jgi:hypothetical protein
MRLLLTLTIAFVNISLYSQDKWFTNTGIIGFSSETEVIVIAGKNEKVVSFLVPASGEMAFALRMTDFTFELPLAREHFNENYVESHKFPTAQFKGQISEAEKVNYTIPGNYAVTVSGELTLHGVSRKISEKGLITVAADGNISGVAVITIRPEDYKIKVPRLVRDKVAEEVKVTIQVKYEPYKDGK